MTKVSLHGFTNRNTSSRERARASVSASRRCVSRAGERAASGALASADVRI